MLKNEQTMLSKLSGKARTDMAAFLESLSRIQCAEDDCGEPPSRQDDHDGVAPMLAKDLADIEKNRFNQLQQQREMFFPTRREEPREIKGTEVGGVNEQGQYGYTALHRAVLSRDIDLVKNLLRMGADWDVPDNHGQTPWDKAYARGYDDILKLFDPDFVRTEPVEVLDFDD